jgi:hypothetical protein
MPRRTSRSLESLPRQGKELSEPREAHSYGTIELPDARETRLGLWETHLGPRGTQSCIGKSDSASGVLIPAFRKLNPASDSSIRARSTQPHPRETQSNIGKFDPARKKLDSVLRKLSRGRFWKSRCPGCKARPRRLSCTATESSGRSPNTTPLPEALPGDPEAHPSSPCAESSRSRCRRRSRSAVFRRAKRSRRSRRWWRRRGWW